MIFARRIATEDDRGDLTEDFEAVDVPRAARRARPIDDSTEFHRRQMIKLRAIQTLRDHGFISVLNAPAAVVPRPQPAGTHHPDGILLGIGPGVRPGAEVESRSILDVAPLLAHSLGLEIPDDYEGALPTAFYDPSYLDADPPRRRRADAAPAAPPVPDATGPEPGLDDQAILLEGIYRARLKQQPPAEWAELDDEQRHQRMRQAVLDSWAQSKLLLRQLAQQRAAAIKDYLVAQGGLADERLYLIDVNLGEPEADGRVLTPLHLDSE